MSSEHQQPSVVNRLKDRRDKLSGIVEERQVLYEKIGTGKVTALSSVENALKIGRVKGKVKDDIGKKQEKLKRLNNEVVVYERAELVLSGLEDERKKMKQLQSYVKEGHLGEEVLEYHREDLEKLETEVRENPDVRRAVGELKKEERRREDEFVLPDGRSTKGKQAQFINIASTGSRMDPVSRESYMDYLYPGMEASVAQLRLNSTRTRAVEFLEGSGLEIVSVGSSENPRGVMGYYLRASEEKKDLAESLDLEDAKEISLGRVSGEIKNYLLETSAKNVVTVSQLEGEFPDLTRKELEWFVNNEVSPYLAKQDRVRVVRKPGGKDEGDTALYTESIREKIKLTQIYTTVEYGGNSIELSENEAKLLQTLVKSHSQHVSYERIMEKYFPSGIPIYNEDVDKFIGGLQSKLEELTGEDDIVVTGGDRSFGYWAKRKDVKVDWYPARLSDRHMQALKETFSDASKENVIKSLGKMKNGRDYQPQHAWRSIQFALRYLNRRTKSDIAEDSEVELRNHIDRYLEKENIEPGQVKSFLREKFGIKKKKLG
jgi:hypothetical protein